MPTSDDADCSDGPSNKRSSAHETSKPKKKFSKQEVAACANDLKQKNNIMDHVTNLYF